MRVPLLDTASRCSATRFEASNLAGWLLISLAWPVAESASQREGGVRKLVTAISALLSCGVVSTTLTEALAGRVIDERFQLPPAAGVNSRVRPWTLSRMETSRRRATRRRLP